MIGSGWAYLLFTGALGAVFAGIVIYYYDRRRRERVEAPKYRMLEDDSER
jgi:cbb3-type cytochrome oxidase subunit 3